jgi:capsular exopolysaccharide synthesis family protein
MFAGIFGGLVLGVTAAFALQVLDPRLRREEQLRRLYRLPILGRIPKEALSIDRPLHPTRLSPATSEAYRTLRGTLGAASRTARRTESRSVLVTGSSPSEGKTTTAISLAASLAAAGRSVILVEADLRRPAIGQALDIRPTHGIVSVLIESVALEDALVTTPAFGANLGLLLADYEGGWITELFALPAAREMIEEASRLADYVVIDSPPLTDVIDALPLANYVDDVLIVVRLGKTRLSKLSQLGEVLAENGTKPAGFAVIGTPRPSRSDYHYYAEREGRLVREEPRIPATTGNHDS